jgi:hypothetical protein
LKYAVRQTVKKVISTEVNIILAKIERLCEIASDQAPMDPRWTEIVTRKHKMQLNQTTDRPGNISEDW